LDLTTLALSQVRQGGTGGSGLGFGVTPPIGLVIGGGGGTTPGGITTIGPDGSVIVLPSPPYPVSPVVPDPGTGPPVPPVPIIIVSSMHCVQKHTVASDRLQRLSKPSAGVGSGS